MNTYKYVQLNKKKNFFFLFFDVYCSSILSETSDSTKFGLFRPESL